MKNLNFRNLIVILSVFAVILVSCKSREEKELVNYWQLVASKNPLRDSIRNIFMDNIATMEAGLDTVKNRDEFEADLNHKKGMLHNIDSSFQSQFAESYIEIKGDGLYDCDLLETKEAGNWSFDKKTSDFVTEPAGEKEGKLRILKINKDSLILGPDDKNCMIFIASHRK
jgi:hypothetical protein